MQTEENMRARRVFCTLAMTGGLAALALVLTASPALAATNDFAIFGSYIKPQSADNSWGGGVKARFAFFELRGTYFTDLTYQNSNDVCPPFCSNHKPRLRFAPLEAGLVYNYADWNGRDFTPVSPYIGGGAGYYLINQTNSGTFGHAPNEFGWYGVGGLNINFNPAIGMMVEFQYRRVRDTVTGPNIGDLSFNKTSLQLGGPGGNVGVVFHF